MPGDAAPQPVPPGEQMRWAIVGTSAASASTRSSRLRRRAPVARRPFVSGNPAKAATSARGTASARFYDYANYDTMKDNAEIDCVYVVLPVGLHAEYTGARARGRQARAVREADGLDQRAECERMVAAAKANNAPARGRLQHRLRADQPRGQAPHRRGRARRDPRDPQRPRGSTPTSRSRRTSGGSKALAGGGSMFDIGIYGLNTSLMMLEGDRLVVGSRRSTPTRRTTFASPRSRADRLAMTMASGINVDRLVVVQPQPLRLAAALLRRHHLDGECSRRRLTTTTTSSSTATARSARATR